MWKKRQLRKPAAAYLTIWAAVLCSLAWYFDKDIPKEAASIMTVLVPTVFASYAATSAYEAAHGDKEDEKKK